MLSPRAYARQRFASWLEARLPLADTVTLNQRNVYILPTRAGLMLAVTLLVLLVASINYQLNLGYLLTFLLAGASLVAMHVAHGTLRGITMNIVASHAIYTGDKAVFGINIQNQRKQARYGIALAVQSSEQWVWTDVAGQSSASVQLAFTPVRRGLHRLPRVVAQTLFPLGTFRVWALWRPAAQVLVYPKPEINPPALPGGSQDSGNSQLSRTHSLGEPDDLRPYRRGDSRKAIVWKKAAKTGELISRDSIALQQHELWLERQHTGLSHPEQQLSRLCAWVLQAEVLGLRYGLGLGDQDIAPDSGPNHQLRCLRALALA